jgi:pyridoxine 4-dehydrogenase
VASGVNHIDTSDFYGPHVTNQLIREALHPYPDDLVIVTKVGAVRGDDASWIPALAPADLTRAVHDNLRNLRLDALDVVNLRVGGVHEPNQSSIEEQFATQLDSSGSPTHQPMSAATAIVIAAKPAAWLACCLFRLPT